MVHNLKIKKNSHKVVESNIFLKKLRVTVVYYFWRKEPVTVIYYF